LRELKGKREKEKKRGKKNLRSSKRRLTNDCKDLKRKKLVKLKKRGNKN